MRQQAAHMVRTDKIIARHQAEALKLSNQKRLHLTAYKKYHVRLFWDMVSNCHKINLRDHTIKQINTTNRGHQLTYLREYRINFRRYTSLLRAIDRRLAELHTMIGRRTQMLRDRYIKHVMALIYREGKRVADGLSKEKLDC
jgi:hypothetical protein